MAEAFCENGITVLRCDLPFRQKRPYGPPLGTADDDQAGLKRAAELLRKLGGSDIFLGGHSYGGRMATMLAAEQPSVASGLLLLSYPLHPPRKPQQLRTAHFPKLQTRALFAQGTRDPFGSIEEMESALQLIPAQTRLVWIEGAGHELAAKSNHKEIADRIAVAFTLFVGLPE
jgi:predicted alpha/beta-hydrolase family hydrolase